MFVVKVYYNPLADVFEMLIIEDMGDGRRAVVLPMKMELRVLERGGRIEEPSLQLDGNIYKPLMKAMAEALDKEGIKTDNDAKLQGTIDATRYHLEDLRTLLKLGKNNKGDGEDGD